MFKVACLNRCLLFDPVCPQAAVHFALRGLFVSVRGKDVSTPFEFDIFRETYNLWTRSPEARHAAAAQHLPLPSEIPAEDASDGKASSQGKSRQPPKKKLDFASFAELAAHAQDTMDANLQTASFATLDLVLSACVRAGG